MLEICFQLYSAEQTEYPKIKISLKILKDLKSSVLYSVTKCFPVKKLS